MKKYFDVFRITHLVSKLVENFSFVKIFYNNASVILVDLTTYVKWAFIDLTLKILNVILNIPFWPPLVVTKETINTFLTTLTRIDNTSMHNTNTFTLPLLIMPYIYLLVISYDIRVMHMISCLKNHCLSYIALFMTF